MASNRDVLRKLTRKFPAPPELEQIQRDLQNASDTTIALTSAALLDAMLERLLESRFAIQDSNLSGRIFLNRGPLSDFDGKILLCNALGLITSPIAQELNMVKTVRNVFAHSRFPLTFDHEAISKEINAGPMTTGIAQYAGMAGVQNIHTKGTFTLCVGILMIMIEEITKNPKSADQVLAEALAE